jgi:outer membrane protein TolC
VKDLGATVKKAEAAYANGVTLKSNLELLKAELLKTGQRRIELASAISAYKEMLGYFIGIPLNEDTRLITPQPLQTSNQVNRPELLLFDYQGRNADIQNTLLSARNRPRLGLFVQGGYGRPALNFLSNSFEPYYIGGVRLSWNLSGFYSLSNERSLIDISRRNIDIQRNTFLFNTEFLLKQQQAEIKKLNELLATDDEIIALRSSIKRSSAAQLENGVINSSDYLKEVNAEDLAVQNKITHQVQLLLSQYTQQTTTGN